jgi:putative endonuclease
MFYVYLLHSTKDNGFYIGYSTDLKRRLSEHRRGASFATKSRGPWKLIYYEAYTEREDAEGREKFLKSGAGRRFLRAQLRHYLQRFPARLKGSATSGFDAEDSLADESAA